MRWEVKPKHKMTGSSTHMVLHCITSKQAQENTKKTPLQVETLYSETCAHSLSLGSLLLGAQAQMVAIPRRNNSQHVCCGNEPSSPVEQGPLVCDLGATHHPAFSSPCHQTSSFWLYASTWAETFLFYFKTALVTEIFFFPFSPLPNIYLGFLWAWGCLIWLHRTVLPGWE